MGRRPRRAAGRAALDYRRSPPHTGPGRQPASAAQLERKLRTLSGRRHPTTGARVSPLTIDYVNPEAPWPQLAELRRRTAAAGHELRPRLPVYPEYFAHNSEWPLPEALRAKLLRPCRRRRLCERGNATLCPQLTAPPQPIPVTPPVTPPAKLPTGFPARLPATLPPP